MGMYDDLIISNVHLPEKLKEHQEGWQTKSLYNYLDRVIITNTGELLWDKYYEKKLEPVNYTGEVRFYKTITGDWYEFVAFVENGKMFKLIQTAP